MSADPSSPSSPAPAPASPVTNQEFLRALFGNAWHRAHVTSFEGDPSDPKLDRACWAGGSAGHWVMHPRYNNYFTVSLFTGPRRKQFFDQLVVLGIDDVGPKVSPDKVRALFGREPTYRIETSPGNEQWGYRLETPITSEPVASAMIDRLIEHLVGEAPDPGMGGVTRYLRLPVGTNQKAALGARFACRLIEFESARRLDQVEITRLAGTLGVDLTAVSPVSPVGARADYSSSTGTDDQLAEHDVLFQAMRRLGLVQSTHARNSAMGRAWDVICPWSDEHTGRATSGTAYVPTLHRFQCHHGHCAGRTAEHLGERLDHLLREDSGGLVGMVDVEWPDLPAEATGASAGSTGSGKRTPARTPGVELAERSEDGLALEFVRQHRHRLRFDHTSQRWHVWDGTRWKLDGTNQAFDWARSVTREFRYSQENDLLQLAKMAVAAAVERGARADQQVAVTHEAWDSDRWRLGTQEDEIDLTTGDTNRPVPGHMITRSAHVSAVARMPAPLWDGFMWDTFGGDIDLIDFMHRWFGYCLSGDVSAEMFAFLYGTGGNGKGVLVHTVSTIAGEYALRVPAEMFMQRRFAEHPTEIAQLMGRRMVIASEVPDGAAFNLSRIKELTGNEGTLSARFMRGNYFEFKPTHKITLVGNHKPRLDHADEAFRRRLILVPFTHTPAVPDPTLKERLVPEYPAILRRLIDGCAEVHDTLVNQKKPFRSLVPATVSAASQSYLVEQDVVAAWLTECCEYDVTARSLTVKPAFLAHTVWCQDEGRTVTAVERTFGEEVVRASGTLGWDLRVQHGMKGKIIQGLRLRA